MRRCCRHLTFSVAVLLGVLVAAADPPGARVAGASPAAAAGRHLVSFTSPDSVPGDLAELVGALGGAVEAAYDGIGMAAVTGLSDAAAAKLAQAKGVAAVVPDAPVAGPGPAATEEPVVAAEDAGLS